MSTVLGLFAEPERANEPARVIPIRKPAEKASTFATTINQDQIQSLIQQVFFTHESTLVRHVGFTTAENSTEAALLCLEVAKALAAHDAYDVGLIDARPDSPSLAMRLRIAPPQRTENSWLIAPRLWMVSRQSWLADGESIKARNLTRLEELTAEFDFSILYCPPYSWLTANIGHACDGLVLVMTANKTRRLAATQIKDLLKRSQIGLLGTVLAERRFPVPQGLYRSL